jgi:hypothetical protein
MIERRSGLALIAISIATPIVPSNGKQRRHAARAFI